MKQGQLQIEPGKPIKIIESNVLPSGNIESSISKGIGLTIKEYRKNISSLIKNKYKNQSHLLHPYLTNPCSIYAFICSDGIIIRYDETITGADEIRVSIIENQLIEVGPIFSDSVIHFPQDENNYTPSNRGPQITISKGKIDSSQNDMEELMSFHFEIFAKSKLPDEYKIQPPPNRPETLISLSNEIVLNLFGETMPNQKTAKEVSKEEQFITNSTLKLNVGWLGIEVYPLLPDEHWKPEHTNLWAELDILSILAQKNAIKTELLQFDSRQESRKYYLNLLNEFESLLSGLEEPVHQFLKSHPELLCPTHERCWSKIQFGNTISDFVFKESYNDYELVEIEAPIRELFRRDGQQRQELTHAINQITDWIQFIQNNKPKVEQELGLLGISTNPRTLVVIGRSEMLTDSNKRKLATLQSQQNKLRIMTYDDVLINARKSLGRFFGNLELQGENGDIYLRDKL